MYIWVQKYAEMKLGFKGVGKKREEEKQAKDTATKVTQARNIFSDGKVKSCNHCQQSEKIYNKNIKNITH